MVAMTTRAAAEEPLGALGAALSGTTADDAGEQLAERAGLSVGAISRLERGVRRSPRVQTLYPTRSRAARGHGSPPSTQRPWRRAKASAWRPKRKRIGPFWMASRTALSHYTLRARAGCPPPHTSAPNFAQ